MLQAWVLKEVNKIYTPLRLRSTESETSMCSDALTSGLTNSGIDWLNLEKVLTNFLVVGLTLTVVFSAEHVETCANSHRTL